MSASRCVRMDGSGAARSASISSNTARQYSGGNSSAGPTTGDALPRAAADGLFLHLFSGRHAPACGSVGHVTIRTYKEQGSSPLKGGNPKISSGEGVKGV